MLLPDDAQVPIGLQSSEQFHKKTRFKPRKEKHRMAFSRSSVKPILGVGIFLLTLATAGIHLYLAFTAIPYFGLNFGVMLFILNGVGYLGLLGALQLPIAQLARFRSAARWALIAYAALTILLWVIMAPVYEIVGYIDKTIEVILIALLIADAYIAPSSEPSGEIPSTRLRACLAKVRVRMVLYALFYEKDLSNRPLRYRMDPFAIVLACPKGAGKTTHPLLARCPRRHLLRTQKWLSLAAFAPRLPSLDHRLLSLQKIAP
jgi:hypothetical protein